MGADVENARGGTGRNIITGNNQANLLVGGQSNDIIVATDDIIGNDRAVGGFGTDSCTVDVGDFEDCEVP